MGRTDIRLGRTSDVSYRFFGQGPLTESLQTIFLTDSSPHSSLVDMVRRPVPAADVTAREFVAVIVLDRGDFSSVIEEQAAVRRNALDAQIENATRWIERHHVGHVVVISTAAVCGAWANRPLITDDEPRVAEFDSGWVGDMAYAESRIAQYRDQQGDDSGTRWTILRPVSLVGPELDTMITRHFEVPRLLEVADTAKRWQFVHVADLAQAIRVVVDNDLAGTLTVGAVRTDPHGQVVPDTESTATVAAIASRRVLYLSQAAAVTTAQRLHRAHILAAPPSDLAYAIHPWVADSKTLVGYGWRNQYSTAECVRQIAAHVTARNGITGGLIRRRNMAALGAAGAAVALAGSIAALRRSRGVR